MMRTRKTKMSTIVGSSYFLSKNGNPELWRKRKVRHNNGTCCCYVAKGMGLNGTRESGKDCEYSKLSGQQQSFVK